MNQTKITSGKIAVVITALLMLQSFLAFSQASFKLELYKPGTAIAKLKMDLLASDEPVKVRVKNAAGTVLYSETSKANEVVFVQLMDFAKLPQGTYFIDIEKSRGVNRKVLVKDENGLFIQEGNLYFHNLIKFQQENSQLLVKFNQNLNQPVTVRIMDSYGNVVHEESGIKSTDYTSLFNLSRLSKGTYSMNLSSGDFHSSRTIKL